MGKNIPIAMPLPVEWAGDTPVLTMTDQTVEGLGTFTVRVLIFGELYSGTWQHGSFGGHMWGRIERAENFLWNLYRRATGGGTPATERDGPSRPPGGAVRPRPESLTPDEMKWRGWNTRYFTRMYHAWIGHHRDAVWARRARSLAARLAKVTPYEGIVTCGPPHMAHDAGRAIARQLRRPLIMDLRDPWSLERRIWEAYASPVWFWLARRHERRCVAHADLVVTNTDEVRRAMEARYPTHGNIVTVMNGFDDVRVPYAVSTPFTVTYAGAIYLDRDPRPLLAAVRKVVDELALTPDRFRVQFVGDVERYGGVPTVDIACDEGVAEYLRLLPRQPLDKLGEVLARSAVLVSLPQDSPYAIPSKVFEYMQFDRWMLVLTEPGSPSHRLLGDSPADVCSPRDVTGIARVLRERYKAFARGQRPDLRRQFAGYDRRSQADTLFDRIETVVRGD
jgi:hypothetical protein